MGLMPDDGFMEKAETCSTFRHQIGTGLKMITVIEGLVFCLSIKHIINNNLL
jgi:hypothetical protein